jgi:hypothetical protein
MDELSRKGGFFFVIVFVAFFVPLTLRGPRGNFFSSRSVYGSYMNSRIGLFMTFEFLFSCSYFMGKG